jgi:hypothetical protein
MSNGNFGCGKGKEKIDEPSVPASCAFLQLCNYLHMSEQQLRAAISTWAIVFMVAVLALALGLALLPVI